MDYKPVVFEKADEVVAAYDSGRCDVYTTDQSGLAAQRLKLKDPNAHMVLPEVISKEPLGPVVRHGDDRWLDIVKWTLYVMLQAEEFGIDSKNVDSMKNSDNPGIKRLLGTEGDMGGNLGLDKEWAYRIVKQVGNYGESFEPTSARTRRCSAARHQRTVEQGRLMYPDASALRRTFPLDV